MVATTSGEARASVTAVRAMPIAGFLLGVGVFVIAAHGNVVLALRETGAFGYLTIGCAFVGALVACALFGRAARGSFALASVPVALLLPPFAVSCFGILMGAKNVAQAMNECALQEVGLLRMRGVSELMSIRLVSASLLLGGAVGAGLAVLFLVRGRRPLDARFVSGALFSLATLAAAVIAEARVIRRAGSGNMDTIKGPLTALEAALPGARLFDHAQLGLLVCTAALALVAIGLAWRSSPSRAVVAASVLLTALIIGLGERALARRVASMLVLEMPGRTLPGFRSAAFIGNGGAYEASHVCVAALDGVRCGDRGPTRYEADMLATLVARPPRDVPPRDEPAHASERGARTDRTIERFWPVLALGIDARLPAASLRALLQAAEGAGYESVEVRGAVAPSSFTEGHVPTWLEAEVPLGPLLYFTLRTAYAEQDARAPTAEVVRDGDTAQSVIDRIEQGMKRTGSAIVMLSPEPLPRVSPPSTPSAVEALGASPTTPTPTPETGPGRQEIVRVMRAQAAPMRRCYEDALRRTPDLEGVVQVAFAIAPSGEVTEVSASGTLPSEPLLRCMERAMRAVTFPPSDATAPIRVHYPFSFTAAR